MLKRITLIAGAVVYFASFIAGTYAYFSVEGSFSFGSRYFWAYTGLPPVLLLMHLAAAVLLLWKPKQAAPVVVAVEMLFLTWAVVGGILFWVTFRWVLLAAVARTPFAALAIHYVWVPFKKDRPLVIAGAGLGLILGLIWSLTLCPTGATAQPLVTSTGVLTVWPRPISESESDRAIWSDDKGIELAGGGRVIVKPASSALRILFPGSRVLVAPLIVLKRVSMDGFIASRLNGVRLGFSRGTKAADWSDGAVRYAYLRFSAPTQAQSSLAEAAALARFRSGLMAADLYTRIDPAGDAVDIVALTHLRQDIFVNQSALFNIAVEPNKGQQIVVPDLGTVSAGETDSGRMVNLQGDAAVLYDCGRRLAPPFDEVNRTKKFSDYIVIEDIVEGKALVIYMPDWQHQAFLEVSPAAGEPICANYLSLASGVPSANRSANAEDDDVIDIEAATVSAEAGRGSPAVPMAKGTYVNRLALRIVPKGADYAQVVAGIKLWELPDWARPSQ